MSRTERLLDRMQILRRHRAPVSGADLAKIVSEIVATPKPIADKLAAIIADPK